MPRGCRWFFVGDYMRDDCASQSWSMYIAKDGRGDYHVSVKGEVDQIEDVADIVKLVGFFEDYGDDTLADLKGTLESFDNSEEACKMIMIRLARFRNSVSNGN